MELAFVRRGAVLAATPFSPLLIGTVNGTVRAAYAARYAAQAFSPLLIGTVNGTMASPDRW